MWSVSTQGLSEGSWLKQLAQCLQWLHRKGYATPLICPHMLTVNTEAHAVHILRAVLMAGSYC